MVYEDGNLLGGAFFAIDGANFIPRLPTNGVGKKILL
jgi:hypothetical protein